MAGPESANNASVASALIAIALLLLAPALSAWVRRARRGRADARLAISKENR